MKVFNTINETTSFTQSAKADGKTIGFVPTMGALHRGHLELMKRARDENDLLLVSIFVNPIQFNNPEDLKKYPRNPEKDKALLEQLGCDLLFAPHVSEMYPDAVEEKYDFGKLEQVMEGAFRDGHFNGVAIVVKRLFDIVQPDKAYFGEKDFQQLAIIRKLVEMEQIPVDIVPCPIVREQDGLAMSSRNERLSKEDRALAPFIYQTLQKATTQKALMSPAEVKKWVEQRFDSQTAFRLEYFEIADEKDLQPVNDWDRGHGILGFVAAYLGKVRLIDNIRFI